MVTMRGASSSLLLRALSGAATAARRSDGTFSSIEALSSASSSSSAASLSLARPLASRSFAASPLPSSSSSGDDQDGSSSSAREGRFAFVDRVRLCAVGGAGGPGCSTFWKNRNGRGAYGPPDGGPGGAGGDVVLVADAGTKSLRGIRPKLRAARGSPGGPAKRAGARGADRLVPVPLGTRVFAIEGGGAGGGERGEGGERGGGGEREGDDEDEDDDGDGEAEEGGDELRQQQRRRLEPSLLVADLSLAGQRFVAAAGGRGGAGNASVPRAQLSAAGSLPSAARASPGELGEVRDFKLELASLADAGLVGPPNVGKSTLLRRLTGARPEVGDYAFTTRRPHLGVLLPHGSSSSSKPPTAAAAEGEAAEEEEGNGGERPCPLSPSGNPFLRAAIAASEEDTLAPYPSSSSSPAPVSGSITVADVPGLLPGAGSARGTGLGHEFLRHVSRCAALAVVVDASGGFSAPDKGGRPRTPREQYEGIVAELRAYDEALSSAARRGGGGGKKESSEREWWREEDAGSVVVGGGGGPRPSSDSPSWPEPPLGGGLLASAARRAIVIANKCDLAPDGGASALRELREAVRSERRRGKDEERERGVGGGEGREGGEREEDEGEIVVVAASGKTGEGIADVARALREAVRSSPSSRRGGGRRG